MHYQTKRCKCNYFKQKSLDHNANKGIKEGGKRLNWCEYFKQWTVLIKHMEAVLASKQRNLEMDFSNGLPLMIRRGIVGARDPSHGFFADNLGPLLGFVIDNDLIGPVNFIVRHNTILKHEPSRPPAFAVIDPFVKYPRDSVPNQVINLHVHHHRLLLLSLTQPSIFAVAVIGWAANQIGSNGRGGGGRRRRRHSEVGED
ncbi:Oxysterol-binding protein-related protein 1C [Senna tora]|uniref:Oxysterol-binding protein-related protein 1C n=1 Tax=Senna tora TaxID=362788 RepID=A0A834WPJ1_9FABA|nr:Oxysterol-binding protein-related protein 1C [Senna tora]